MRFRPLVIGYWSLIIAVLLLPSLTPPPGTDVLNAPKTPVQRGLEAALIFSRKTDYGLRALMYLADKRGRGPVTLTEIAEKLTIPKAFLSKILQQLAKKSVVRSLKGPNGGFVLAVEPAEVTMQEILLEIDGPTRVFECFGAESDCGFYDDCMIRDVFGEVEAKIGQVLAQYTLADFQKHRATKT